MKLKPQLVSLRRRQKVGSSWRHKPKGLLHLGLSHFVLSSGPLPGFCSVVVVSEPTIHVPRMSRLQAELQAPGRITCNSSLHLNKGNTVCTNIAYVKSNPMSQMTSVSSRYVPVFVNYDDAGMCFVKKKKKKLPSGHEWTALNWYKYAFSLSNATAESEHGLYLPPSTSCLS